ncbi:MAG: 16S rRNA (adenine(1518)-N(6)/adenine(1519)-N(6))-dimethyltransferase RsmA [Actinomycetota bacterium]
MAEDGTQTRSEIRRLLAEHGHRPTKTYGQNFLADRNVVRRMVDVADVDHNSKVVEIGAGTGTLTTELAGRCGLVVAYEIDHSLAPVLEETIGGFDNVELRFGDASKAHLGKELGEGRWTMVANLPYNVGTGIILDALQQAAGIERIVAMVQSELADRLLADAGTKTYGLPSVTAGLHAVGRRAFSAPPQVFEPEPRVESAVIVLDRIDAPPSAPRAIELAAAAFNQRRKMLRRSLAETLTDTEKTLERAGIDPTTRPEQLSPLDFASIADAEGDQQ